MAFPSGAANGTVATVNGVSYTYNSTTGAWNKTSAGVSGATVVTTGGATFTGPVTFQSTVSYSTPLQFAAGTVSAPSVSFSTATTTGLYAGSGTLGLATSGAVGIYIDASQNVGVATASPSYKLDVNGAARTQGNHIVTGRLQVSGVGDFITAINDRGVRIVADSTDAHAKLQFTNNAQNSEWCSLYAYSTGRINQPGGSFQTPAIGINTTPGGTGSILATGLITAYYSDKRLKTISGNIENALTKVRQLNGVLYVENEIAKSFGYDDDSQQVGVIAQEVQAVQPEAVALAPFDRAEDGSSKSGETYLTVHYEKLVPLLIEAIKELSSQVDDLKAEIDIIKRG